MPEEEPLNLVPIMNLVTILIPVLLMAIKCFGIGSDRYFAASHLPERCCSTR